MVVSAIHVSLKVKGGAISSYIKSSKCYWYIIGLGAIIYNNTERE